MHHSIEKPGKYAVQKLCRYMCSLAGSKVDRTATRMHALDYYPSQRSVQEHPSRASMKGALAVQVLLLDEITVDLDVLGRADLLAFLREECEQRGATIIYVRSPLHPAGRPFCRWPGVSKPTVNMPLDTFAIKVKSIAPG